MTENKRPSLASLLGELENAKSDDAILAALDSIVFSAAEFTNDSKELLQNVADRFANILESNQGPSSMERTARATAELAKLEVGRGAFAANKKLMVALSKLLLHLEDQPNVQLQACRALGNICYENDDGRAHVLEMDKGLETVIQLLGQAIKENQPLKSVVAGFLLNLLAGQEETQRKALELGIVPILTEYLESGSEEGNGQSHILMILNLLADINNELLTDRLCQAMVNLLGQSSSGELSEMCLELMLSQSESENVKSHLAKAQLCEQLNGLAHKHKDLLQDDEARGLLKLACDLIVSVLTGDEAMELLYMGGEGQVFKEMTAWLSIDDEDLQITAVLAMGNFARTDKHCMQIVKKGIGKKLLDLVAKNNAMAAGIRLQHALLSALRNLAIPAENKAILLKDGLLDSILPMIEIPTLPVVFKLLGTLRMAIDGQESAACQLGVNSALLSKVVSWCTTEDHPGVQGEANRLLAWMVKNAKSSEVNKAVAEAGGVKCLANMLMAEHTVMKNEALLALILISTSGKNLPEPGLDTLLDSTTASNLSKVLKESKETSLTANGLTLLKLLAPLAKESLIKAGIPSILKSLSSDEDVMKEAQVVSKMFDSG
ncbi:GTPase-GDP dissociation stimulator vimar [Cloeon dipterum]|uniref:GTPase-GDP dissociation stimulator vimar n=1 Tax=Cloeon dipterum TaxID=197152 RepID=UPI00321FE083